QGQHIDLSLVDAQMAWLINEGCNYLTSGQVPERRGNAHPNIVPYDVFAASDGHVILAVGNDAQFQRFCAAFAREDLGGAPDYQTNPDRVRNRVALTAEIATTLANVTVTDILDRLQAVNVPCGPINTVSKALASDQAEARDTVVSMAHPETEAGAVRLLGNPLKLSKTPATYRQPPPVFGQDAGAIDAILAGLGKKLLGDQ
ncbi:MAG: CoA transferase, partial [Pseudomonadota bacterium]